jgi:hypothetical protein
VPRRGVGDARACAIRTSALDADDPTQLLREHSVPRLRELARIVDAHGRPWKDK